MRQGVENIHRSADVVLGVLPRIFHRFAGGLECGQVNHTVPAFFEDLFQERRIHNVTFKDFRFPGGIAAASGGVIVQNRHRIAAIRECMRDMAADVSSAAYNEYVHESTTLRSISLSRP